jgi:hypothetical protein
VKHADTIDAKPRSLPPTETISSLMSFSRATGSSWSPCDSASPYWPSPPLDPRQMFLATPPLQARLIFSATGIVLDSTSAVSERWQRSVGPE